MGTERQDEDTGTNEAGGGEERGTYELTQVAPPNDEREEPAAEEVRRKPSKPSPWLTHLLAFGLGLLLTAGYIAYQNRERFLPPPTLSAQAQAVSDRCADITACEGGLVVLDDGQVWHIDGSPKDALIFQMLASERFATVESAAWPSECGDSPYCVAMRRSLGQSDPYAAAPTERVPLEPLPEIPPASQAP